MPLTKEQFRRARESGKTVDEIIEFENREKESIGGLLGRNLREAATKTRKEAAEIGSTALLGIPRAAVRKFAPEAETDIFPEKPEVGSQILGLSGGIAAKGSQLALRGAQRLLPKLAGKGILKGAAKGTIGGGTFGGLQQPPEGKSRVKQAAEFGAVGGLLGGGVPALGAGARAGKKAIDLAKSNFINEKVVPKVSQKFNQELNKFTPAIQKFAEESIKIPKNVIQHIAKRKPIGIQNTVKSLKNGTDDLFSNMQQSLAQRNEQVVKAYGDAFKNVNATQPINISKTFSEMRSILKRNGFIDEVGNLTSRAKDPAQSQALKFIASEFQALTPEVGITTTQVGRTQVGGINKFVWMNLRDKLSQLNAGAGRLSPDLTRILDKLHSEAESAGAVGIQNARSLAREFFKHESLANKFISERKLDRIFKFTGQESRDLKTLERYLKTNIENQAKDIVASQSLGKLNDIGNTQIFGEQSKLIRRLKQADNPAEFKSVKREFEDLFGKSKDLDKVFSDIKKSTIAQDIKTLGIRPILRSTAIRGLAPRVGGFR